MKKEILSIHEGENVRIKLFDNKVLEGKLEYIPEFNAKFGYAKPGFFRIGDMSFRASHVKTLKVIL